MGEKISNLCLLIFINVIEVEVDCFNGGWSVEVYGIRSVNAMVNARWSVLRHSMGICIPGPAYVIPAGSATHGYG